MKQSTTSSSSQLHHVTLEIYSTQDPFFHYTTSIDRHDFQNIKSISNLLLDFTEYPNYLMKIFNKIVEKSKNTATLTIGYDGGVT